MTIALVKNSPMPDIDVNIFDFENSENLRVCEWEDLTKIVIEYFFKRDCKTDNNNIVTVFPRVYDAKNNVPCFVIVEFTDVSSGKKYMQYFVFFKETSNSEWRIVKRSQVMPNDRNEWFTSKTVIWEKL